MATVAFTTRANLVGGQPENIADVADCLDKLLAGINSVDVANLSAALTNAISQAGDLKISGATAVPTGWLLCDGTAVSRSTYATLFAAISTTYGVGDAATTFNLPDLRGRVPVGVDGAAARMALNSDTLGAAGGFELITLSVSEMPSHTHTTNLAAGAQAAAGTGAPAYSGGAGTSSVNANTGGGGAHNNMQPYQVVNYFIKT